MAPLPDMGWRGCAYLGGYFVACAATPCSTRLTRPA